MFPEKSRKVTNLLTGSLPAAGAARGSLESLLMPGFWDFPVDITDQPLPISNLDYLQKTGKKAYICKKPTWDKDLFISGYA